MVVVPQRTQCPVRLDTVDGWADTEGDTVVDTVVDTEVVVEGMEAAVVRLR
jgi:hypothetical protein